MRKMEGEQNKGKDKWTFGKYAGREKAADSDKGNDGILPQASQPLVSTTPQMEENEESFPHVYYIGILRDKL